MHFIGKKRIFVVALLCLLFSCSLFTQESDDWFYSKTITSIKFSGLQSLRPSEMGGVVSSFVGKKFTDELYFDLLGRLSALEYFESIEPTVTPGDPDYRTAIITFTVVENPVVSKLSFVGNRSLRTTELKAKVNIKEEEIFSETKLSGEERALREYYLSKGYTNVRISTNYEHTEKGVEVSFLINEGTATSIRSITFEGNQIISSRTLRGTLKLKEKTFFNKGAFQESMLEYDKQSVITYYRNRGYIDAVLTDVIREENVDENGNTVLDLVFIISEGYQYTYGGIDFSGNMLFSSEFLADKIRLDVGEVFNYTKFQDGLSAVADVYYENGYITTAIQPQQAKDADRRQISFTVLIDERSRSHVESIIVQGNKKTKSYVIERELPFVAGDIFSRTKLMQGYRNLTNLQYFSSVMPEVIPGSEDDLVNVVYSVEDQSTTSIEFGLSFAGIADPNAFPVSLFAKWQDSNLMGTGRTVAVEGNASPEVQSLSLSYGDNWVFGEPITFGSSVSVSRSKDSTLQKVYTPSGIDTVNYTMPYTAWNVAVSNTLGKRWFYDKYVVSLTGGLSNVFLRNSFDKSLEPVDSTITDYENNWGLINTVSAQVSVDSRDFRYDPSSGLFASQRFAWTGFLPKYETQFFMRSDTIAEGYWTLLDTPVTEKWNLKLTLASISKLSFLEPMKNKPINSANKLSIDGMFNGRGWDSIYTIKGEAMFSNNLELRVPLWPNVLAGDFFFDTVVLKNTPKDMMRSTKINDFYFSFGPGVRSLVNQFPLRLMLANTFKIENGSFKWGNGSKPDMKVVISFTMVN